MTKPPSAELAPDQRDDDTLPPYEFSIKSRLHIEEGLVQRQYRSVDLSMHWLFLFFNALKQMSTSDGRWHPLPEFPHVHSVKDGVIHSLAGMIGDDSR